MAAVPDVTITAGVPTGGTGTVSTLDKFDGAAGAPATRAVTIQGIGSGTAVPVSIASVPSHAVTNAGTFAAQVTTINGVAPAFGTGARGATVQRVTIATDDSVPVTIASVPSHAVTNAGTFAVQDSAVLAAVTDATIPLVAHDAPDSGDPLKIGAKATASLSAATMVAAADRTNLFAGLDGVLLTRPHSNLEDMSAAFISCTSGANTSALAAAGAGIKWYVTGCLIYNNGAANGALLLTDGSGGSTKAKVPYPASTGTVVTFPLPVAFTANTAVFADPSGSDTIDVTIFGFKSKV